MDLTAKDGFGKIEFENGLALMLGHGANGINVLELSNRLITAFGSATELAKADWRMVIEHIRVYIYTPQLLNNLLVRNAVSSWYNVSMELRLDENGCPLDRTLLIGRAFVHFKGKRYQLLDFAKNSETEELMVVYRTLYGALEHWVRPARMFFETIVRDGYVGPRFRLEDVQ